MCYGFPGWPSPPEETDPLKAPLKPELPKTWAEREKMVEWVRTNFSRGMLALLYKLSHDSDRVRIARDQCEQIIRNEKESLKK